MCLNINVKPLTFPVKFSNCLIKNQPPKYTNEIQTVLQTQILIQIRTQTQVQSGSGGKDYDFISSPLDQRPTCIVTNMCPVLAVSAALLPVSPTSLMKDKYWEGNAGVSLSFFKVQSTHLYLQQQLTHSISSNISIIIRRYSEYLT